MTADQLERFVSAIDTLMELGRVVQVVNNERQTFDLEQDADELDNTIRALEPVVQIIMETVAPGLSKYESPEAQRHRPTSGTPQEQEQNRSNGLFRDLPELLSPVVDGPVMCRGFFISAGQQTGGQVTA